MRRSWFILAAVSAGLATWLLWGRPVDAHVAGALAVMFTVGFVVATRICIWLSGGR